MGVIIGLLTGSSRNRTRRCDGDQHGSREDSVAALANTMTNIQEPRTAGSAIERKVLRLITVLLTEQYHRVFNLKRNPNYYTRTPLRIKQQPQWEY
jgi:peptide methionine sulfoxide reductase MsrA